MLSSGFVRAAGLLIGLFNSTLIARMASAEMLGIHALWIAMTGWTVSIGQFGFRTWITREVANNRISLVVLLKIGFLTASFAAAVSLFFFQIAYRQIESIISDPSALFLALFVVNASIGTFKASIVSANKGLGNVNLAEFSEGVISRLCLTSFIVVSFVAGKELTILILLSGVSVGLALGLTVGLGPVLRSRRIAESRASVQFPNLVTIIPFWGISLSNLFAQRVDMLVLGWFASPQVIGFYRIANSIVAALSGIHEAAKNSVIGILPHWTSQPDARKAIRGRVKQVVTLSTVMVLAGTVGFVVFGKFLLTFVWGTEFVAAYGILVVLLISKTISTSAGPVGMAATMNGLEAPANVVFWIAAILNIAASTVLVIIIGGVGVAFGTLLANILFNSSLLFLLIRRLNFNTTAFV